jgi:hypothetical protein
MPRGLAATSAQYIGEMSCRPRPLPASRSRTAYGLPLRLRPGRQERPRPRMPSATASMPGHPWPARQAAEPASRWQDVRCARARGRPCRTLPLRLDQKSKRSISRAWRQQVFWGGRRDFFRAAILADMPALRARRRHLQGSGHPAVREEQNPFSPQCVQMSGDARFELFRLSCLTSSFSESEDDPDFAVTPFDRRGDAPGSYVREPGRTGKSATRRLPDFSIAAFRNRRTPGNL